MAREDGPHFRVGDTYLRVGDMERLVELANRGANVFSGEGIRLESTGGGTVVSADPDFRPVSLPSQFVWKARVTAYAANNQEFIGRRLNPDLTDFDTENITVKTFRYEGTVGVDNLREMVPFIEPSAVIPPPRKAQIYVVALPSLIDPGPPQVHGVDYYLGWGCIGTCAQGAADVARGMKPIVQTAIVQMLSLLKLAGFDSEKLAKAERLLPQCCGGTDGV